MSFTKDFKLIARYTVLIFISYLAYKVTSVEYINALSENKETLLNVIVSAIFGTLTLVLKFHFETKLDKTE